MRLMLTNGGKTESNGDKTESNARQGAVVVVVVVVIVVVVGVVGIVATSDLRDQQPQLPSSRNAILQRLMAKFLNCCYKWLLRWWSIHVRIVSD